MRKLRLKQWLMFIMMGLAVVVLSKIGTYYFMIPALACLVYGLIEPYWLQHKEVYFVYDKIPKSFEGFKIAFISDFHHSPVYSRNRLKALVKRVNMQNPDLILLGGDYIDHQHYIQSCFEELKNLKAPFGVYGVLGNHDHKANSKMVVKAMGEAGIICLDNKSVWLKKDDGKIKLGGVGDYWFGVKDLQPTVKDVQPEDFVLLLSHNPDFVEEIKTDKIDLVLCGHTHGGQGTIFGLWAPFIPSQYGQKYRTGLIKTPNTKVLISNGVGNTGHIPIRFFARPQMNVVYLGAVK